MDILKQVIELAKENKTIFIMSTILVLGLLFGDKVNARNNKDFPIVDTHANAAKMSVLLESNGATKVISFQCNDISECAERVAERMNEKGSCNPQVNKILIEKIYIPGM